jgi:hypothetical protein
MMPRKQFGERALIAAARCIHKLFVTSRHEFLKHSHSLVLSNKLVILNVTEGGVTDLLYLSFNTGAKRRST